jgi:hypothetical protein
MSDRDEHAEDEGVPMELFWLGNLDEDNNVDADYLDEVRSELESRSQILYLHRNEYASHTHHSLPKYRRMCAPTSRASQKSTWALAL